MYWVPEPQGTSPQEIADHARLAYAFDRPPSKLELMGTGPGGKSGVMLVAADSMGRYQVGYHPDEQEWHRRPAGLGPEVWVGYYLAAPPGPDELARLESLRGYRVRLGDGREWVAPRVLAICSQPALPRRMVLNDAGNFVPGDVCPQYAHLSEICERYVERAMEAVKDAVADDAQSGDLVEFSCGPDEVADAVTLLAVNYRISKFEASLLGLFTEEDSGSAVLRASSEWDFFTEAVIARAKKNQLEH